LAQVMWRDLSRAAPGELLTEAHERLNRRPGQGAVVVAEGQVIGLLSPADLLRLAEIAEAAPQAVRTGPGA
jgi:signal-transduction protein with cAMP-binding, CBS, and nucleotidyltransferase domain